MHAFVQPSRLSLTKLIRERICFEIQHRTFTRLRPFDLLAGLELVHSSIEVQRLIDQLVTFETRILSLSRE